MFGCQASYSRFFFSLAEAVGWQRISWWWQLNDLFFIKHLLLSLHLSLTTALPLCLSCLFLSFDWLLFLSSSISHSSDSFPLHLSFIFSPPPQSRCLSLESPGLYLYWIVSVSAIVAPPRLIERREYTSIPHLEPSASQQLVSLSICLTVTQPASQSLCCWVNTLIRKMSHPHKAWLWSQLIPAISVFCLSIFLVIF